MLAGPRRQWRSALRHRFHITWFKWLRSNSTSGSAPGSMRNTPGSILSIWENCSTKSGEKRGQPEALAMRAVAAVQPQHVVHHAVEARAVVVDDAEQPRRGLVHPGLLPQELGGMADAPRADCGSRARYWRSSRPSAASFSCRACACMRVRSSRKITAPTSRSRADRHEARAPLALTRVPAPLSARRPVSRHCSHCAASAGAYSASMASRSGRQRSEQALGLRG